MKEQLIVKGARQHNLKNITVEIPRDELVVVCLLYTSPSPRDRG